MCSQRPTSTRIDTGLPHTLLFRAQKSDWRLHDARYPAVLRGAAPHLPLRPEEECAQLMHGGMIVICNLIGQRQGRWIEDTGFTPEQPEKACCLLDAQA